MRSRCEGLHLHVYVLHVDYDEFVVIYSCTASLGGAIAGDLAWILTRDRIELGTPEHDAMKEKSLAILTERVPEYD